MNIRNKSGFTLLEIIIVIIIVGVLASLALPRFFSTVEFARSTEALNSLGVLRKSILRCGMMNDNVVGCDAFADIDIDNPGAEPGSHFSYDWVVTGANTFTITATRNTVDGGTAGDTIVMADTATGATRAGTTAFASIK